MLSIRNKKLILLIFSFFITFNAFPSTSGGFVGGGGGTGVSQNNRLYFLDLLQFDKSLGQTNDIFQTQKLILNASVDVNQETLLVPYFNKNGSLDKINQITIHSQNIQSKLNADLLNSEPVRYAKETLSQYGFVLWLPLQGLQSLNWIFTSDSPPPQLRFDLNETLDYQVETVAYYSYRKEGNKRSWQAALSVPRWNRLDFFGQVGLIIHESLRHYQLGVVSRDRGLEFSEQVLQKSTALITLCKHHPYIEQYLLRYLSSYNGYFGGEEGLGSGYTYEEATAKCIRRDF